MIWILLHYLIVAACVVRIVLRPHRDPAARAAWVLTTLAVPLVGVLAYLLLGETSIGRRRLARLGRIEKLLPDAAHFPADAIAACASPRIDALFRVGASISGFAPCPGNVAELMADSDATIDAIVADIDAAADHVHLQILRRTSTRSGDPCSCCNDCNDTNPAPEKRRGRAAPHART